MALGVSEYHFELRVLVKKDEDGKHIFSLAKGPWHRKRTVRYPVKIMQQHGTLRITVTGVEFIPDKE